ncbi:uncharacterized protein LOC119737221 isoform X2 [Patiria miniata]|uniref:HTH CENPB-type domain-containing protein n=1 Tax=Patiria miniata TaxID=46514 RepID=A0A914ATG9_PATMI|nr:uncharacterized protein LOC119737221 isoform X2 [Patiria miniata]
MLVKEKDKDKDTTGSKSWEPRHCGMEEGQGRPRGKAKSRSLLRMMKTKDKDNDVGNETKGDNLLRMMNASREYMNCIVCCSTSRKIFMICCEYCHEWYHRDCSGIGRDASNRIIKNTCPPCASISKLNAEEEEAGKDMAEQEEEAIKATGTAVRQQRRFPCGQCEPCKVVDDCGKCSFCLDKTKFGGQNKWRQKCLFRTCIRMASNPTPTIDVSLVDHNDYIARPESDPTTEKKKQKKKKKKKDKKKKKLEDKEKQKEPEKRKQSQQEPTIDEPQPKRVCFPAAEEDLPQGKTTGAKSATAGKTASKLDTLLIANKVNLIEEVENCGTKNRTDIAAEWGISISELNGIMRKKGMVMEQFRKQCLIQARQVEEAVLMWCKAAQAMNILVTRQILEEKAKSLAKKLGFPNFTVSDGWLDLFKARNNVSFNVVARAGAAGLSDERKALSSTSQLRVHQMVKDWLTTDLSPLLVVYKPSNIFNANETGIFYRLLPDRLLAFKGKACNGGERSEERLTAMVCANMDGSEKLPLLVIGNTKKPQCLANVKSLPTLYEANKTAWMTSDIFEAWARNIDKMCQKKNRKIAIVIDSCPAHPHITGLKSVTLVFLSPLQLPISSLWNKVSFET